ncbi:MAG: hypothetical protein JWO12_1224, partial [Frankiales bacterium]|nr:hypothetical protein [Frankiales bacterium]
APALPSLTGTADLVLRRSRGTDAAAPPAGADMPPGAVAAFQAAAASQHHEQEGAFVSDEQPVMVNHGGAGAPAPSVLGRRQMEEIVDSVVKQLERRVLDELERRGRRHVPGVF